MKLSLTSGSHMSAQYPALNSDDHGFDRWYLATGEVSSHSEGTNAYPTSQHIDWWHKLNRLRRGSSLTPTMVARLSKARRRHGVLTTRAR